MISELEHNIATIHAHQDILYKTYHVKSIGIFGSTVRGEQKQSSDIDILVELSQPMGFFKFIELENFLSGILHKKVDLVTKKALKPAIRESILRDVTYA